MAPRDGAHRFVERKIDESAGKRGRPDRGRFRKAIGVVDERLPPYLERFGNEASPALVAEADGYKVYQVRWDVLAGVHGEGLWLRPGYLGAGKHIIVRQPQGFKRRPSIKRSEN